MSINTGARIYSEREEMQNSKKQLAEVHTGRILLAEDVELNQEIAATILGDAGFEVET